MRPQTLTFLFTDMVGSTSFFSRLPEREAERTRREHVVALLDEIEHRGGRRIKSVGDGVMAAFLNAGEAIEAGRGVQRATTRTVTPTEARWPPTRIGISSGDAYLDEGDYFGVAVVEASRLCDVAQGGQVLVAESSRLLARTSAALRDAGELSLKGLVEPTRAWEALWSSGARPLRVVLADDTVLLREGVARLLHERGVDVVAQVGNSQELLLAVDALRPDLAIVDVRMPPTFTAEGLSAAERILADRPRTGVLLLSHDIEPRYAERMLAVRQTGVGYLLKERVADVSTFDRAVRRVADGGQAFDPLVAHPALSHVPLGGTA